MIFDREGVQVVACNTIVIVIFIHVQPAIYILTEIHLLDYVNIWIEM